MLKKYELECLNCEEQMIILLDGESGETPTHCPICSTPFETIDE